MKIDGKKILKKLESENEPSKQKLSFYLSKKLYEDFKKCCGNVPASQVIEELMKEFVGSFKK